MRKKIWEKTVKTKYGDVIKVWIEYEKIEFDEEEINAMNAVSEIFKIEHKIDHKFYIFVFDDFFTEDVRFIKVIVSHNYKKGYSEAVKVAKRILNNLKKFYEEYKKRMYKVAEEYMEKEYKYLYK